MEEKVINEEFIETLKESEKIIEEIKNGKRKSFNNVEDLVNSLETE